MEETNKIEILQDKIEGVKQVMNDNIQFALSNTDKIENIEGKSLILAESSNRFREKGNALKKRYCTKYYCKIISIISLVVSLIFMIIIFLK